MVSCVIALGCSSSDDAIGGAGQGGAPSAGGTAGGVVGNGGGAAGSSAGGAGVGGNASGGRASGGTSGGGASGGGSGGVGYLPGANGRWVSIGGPFTGGGSDLSAVKLDDGSVLIIGWASQGYRFVPDDDMFVTTSAPPDARAAAAAALLEDGRVLVAGGRSSSARDGLASCFLYDPASDSWAPTADLPAERAQQAAITLPDGDVLVAGGVGPGIGGTPLADVYRYRVSSGQWETLAPLAEPVRFPELFLLDAETALIMSENSQVYDLGSQSVSASPALTEGRRYATPVQLASSSVLAVGGAPLGVLGDDDVPFATVDEYALGGTNWLVRAPLGVPRSAPGAVTLRDGTVLVAGGAGAFVGEADPAEQSAERYLPAVDAWYPEAPPPVPTGSPAVLLDDGSVLFISGARFYPEPWQ